MPPDLPPGALTDRAPDNDPLARARELVADLLEMVAEVRRQAAELEAERDELRRQVAESASDPPPDAPPEGDAPGDHRARHGDLGRALAPVLSAPGRRNPALTALLGGETA